MHTSTLNAMKNSTATNSNDKTQYGRMHPQLKTIENSLIQIGPCETINKLCKTFWYVETIIN